MRATLYVRLLTRPRGIKLNSNSKNYLPTFSDIVITEVPENLNTLLSQNRAELTYLLQQKKFTWNNLMQPLELMNDRLHHFWSRISHMNAVVNSPELRKAYNQCLPKLSDYYTFLSHNHALYQAIVSLTEADEYANYGPAQKMVLTNKLRDFKLSGVLLNKEDKKRFAKLTKELSELSTKFEENVLDATAGWTKLITNKKDLKGIPDYAVHAAKQRAENENKAGWIFTLEFPIYLAVIMHAENCELREEFYHAYITRASDQGPNANEWDNSQVMFDIMQRRLELAKLLGFDNAASESLATKMAASCEQVLAFLNDLSSAALPKAKKEFAELREFAKNHLHINPLNPWDIAFTAEKLRQHKYNISQEELRPYFEESTVIKGLFSIVKRLFQVTFKEITQFDSWHKDVRLYAVYDRNENLISYCYIDLHARGNKRGGAWMDDCQIRRKLTNEEIQLPIAFITCNFTGPTANMPALFSHEEVVTLFHEFGHALQHMLTTVDYADVSGINGIPWDAVELPSQFLENWAWEKESLKLFAKHYKTNKPLPDDLFNKLHQAKNFQSAMQMQRQLEFALFDFLLHMQFDPGKPNQIQEVLDEVRAKVSVLPHAKYNRFQHGFSHIFAGGYAAGYYCYKWAEVMASDAFALFLEKGIFNKEAANKFLTYILQPGGSEEAEVLFKKFRGHDPHIDALLKQSGIINHDKH